jgi:capsular polysaccharide biosynthesis protein
MFTRFITILRLVKRTALALFVKNRNSVYAATGYVPSKPPPIEIDHTSNLPQVPLRALLTEKIPAQTIVVPEQYVRVTNHRLSVASSNEDEQKFYSNHDFRAPELTLERLVDQYWFPESGFLISKTGKAWRHSVLGQYGDPNFLTTYAVEERVGIKGLKEYSFYEHLLHDAPEVVGINLITSHYASHNFGHFMMDMVPLIHLALKQNLNVISKPLLEWQKPIYQSVGLDPDKVVTFPQRAVFLREVLVSNRHNAVSTYAASPDHRQIFDAMLRNLSTSEVPTQSSPRIFISRGESRNRDIRNRTELELALQKEGFETIRPETLSFAKQALLFSQAEVIVTEFGAVLANAVFCKPGTRIIEIIPENQNDPWSSHLCSSMGLEHVVLFHKVKNEDRESFEIAGRIHNNIFFKFDADVNIIIDTVRKISGTDAA